MGNRRRIASSEEEEEEPPLRKRHVDENKKRKRKKVLLLFDDEEYEEAPIPEKRRHKRNKQYSKDYATEFQEEDEDEEEEEEELEAEPLGDVIRVSGKGRTARNHYQSFDYDGFQYHLEDPVLLVPEQGNQKPYVAIIKDIARTRKGSMMVTGQWFYRPEEAEKKGGGNWQSRDTRELFYSFHRDEVPAESVMHKCVVHFIPLHKQIPPRKQHPGFIVQRVYDTDQRRLFKLTDKDYEDNKQHEIDLLVNKTLARLGDLPDLEPDENSGGFADQMKSKRLLKRKNMSPLDVSREDGRLGKSLSFKGETPGSTTAISSEYYTIMSDFKILTSDTYRNKCLEKLLQAVQFVCTPGGAKPTDSEDQVCAGIGSIKNDDSKTNKPADKVSNGNKSFIWPDAAVPVVAALEQAAHDTLSGDFQKYNQKMRTLSFNLKKNALLVTRLLKRELEPAQILNMSPIELKEGLTSEEIASREPEESGHVQMTDAHCTRCSEQKVRVKDIIQTGHDDRYKLECDGCGHDWYASRDDAAQLTIETPNTAKTVGTASSATAKFEDVEKNLVSPRGPAAPADTKGRMATTDALKKTAEASVPLLETQKSFNKTRNEENPPSPTSTPAPK